MTLHLWNQAADPDPWAATSETRPVRCGRWVNYQEITRDPDNCTCNACLLATHMNGVSADSA